ncbi:gliding motility lipoprotein GldH [Rhodonellum sp.]|uniref:gliding motility lipoprotein GldH n=1 Tax=Rhodonellum sp. TaxID=2231180 RepID=UPI00271739AA|nr:gliding motility lipoprotein GldH [Rhodonellum sp.]MDO9551506.1 gliding motility lipoprotein GldH [Rhodonellum sp.]
MTKLFFNSCLLFLLFGLFSCDRSRIFEEYRALDSKTWNVQDTISFEFPYPIEDGETILGIRYNQDYEYRNLYVRYFLKDSLGNNIENQLLEIPLFESISGKPIGKGYGSTFTKYDTIPLVTQEKFHSIQFLQYMRIDDLVGIEAVGVKKVKR